VSFAVRAFAQNPAQPALPVPPGAPAAAAQSSTNTQKTAGAMEQLQFPNADIGVVLDWYERKSGRRLIRDNQVIGQVNIVVNEPIPREEALKIIEINLIMNGFSLIPVDEKLWKVIGTGKSPRNFGIPILSDVEELPENTEQIVTFLTKLEYSDPVELSQTLAQAFPAGGPVQIGQALTPLPKAGALLITENSVIIRGILRIIREIDLPPAEVESVFFNLERADAKDVLEKLQDIIQPKTQTGTTTTPVPANVPRPGGAAAAAAARTGLAVNAEGLPVPQPATVEVTGPNTIEVNSGRVLSEDAVVVGKTILQADQRTNRIHVVTRPINLKFFRKLIEELDAETIFGEPVVFPLKFVQAGDIIESLKRSISDPGAKEEGAGGTAGARPGQTNRGASGSNQNLFDNNRFGNNQGGFGGLGGGGGTGGFSESLSAEERDIVPETFTVGNTRVIADKRANSIIVIGNKDIQRKVFAVLEKLDVRAPQVEIHTVIGTLALTNDEQFGVDYVLRKGGDNGLRSGTGNVGGTQAGDFVIRPGQLTNPTGLNIGNLLNQSKITQIATAGMGGFSGFFTAANSLDVLVSALMSTSRFKVVATPHVFTSNNKKAVISSGEEVAVPTSIQSSPSGVNQSGNFVTNSSIQFKTIALQLEVLPLINADGEVSLEIVQKIDEQAGTTKIDNNDVPRIATRVLKTNVTVPNGGTLVLGGLRRERNDVTKSGIPYLSKIPGLGALFRSTHTMKTRDELVIMMRPQVTTTPRAEILQREKNLEGFVLEPDLEATLTPPGIRKNVPPGETFRTGTAVLRENIATPIPRIKGLKK
jgi:general secretion pathway protein D